MTKEELKKYNGREVIATINGDQIQGILTVGPDNDFVMVEVADKEFNYKIPHMLWIKAITKIVELSNYLSTNGN